MFSLESYLMQVAGYLNWTFFGIQEDVVQALNDVIDTVDDPLVPVFCLQKDMYGSSKFSNDENIPVRLEMPWITEGDTRYLIGNIFLTKKFTVDPNEDYLENPFDEFQPIRELNSAFTNLPFKHSRIGIGDFVLSYSLPQVSYRIGIFISTNSNIGF